MEEEGGFEPPRVLTPLSVFKTDPFSRTWVFLQIYGPYITKNFDWSGRQDSNLRPLGPKPSALPS